MVQRCRPEADGPGVSPIPVRVRYRNRLLLVAVLGNVVPVAIATATDFDSHHTVFFVGAVISCLAPMIVVTVSRRHRVPFYLGAYGGLVGATMLLAYSGGVASGYAVLMMMAMVWFGLAATDREQLAGLALLAAACFLPMLIFGPPAYPVSWGHAILLVIVGVTVAGSLRALTREMQRLNRNLREQATLDHLTGLLNRRGWAETAPRELARASRLGTPVALVLLDLDAFKELNDTHGHADGDRVLRETADRLGSALRAGDVVARIGGDEFAGLLTDSTPDGAIGAINRLIAATPSLAAFSAGVAVWDRGEDLDELVKRCDLALYEAKRSGGGTVRAAPGPIVVADFEADSSALSRVAH
jgi:diguanylate cyclase (GGDEF)-like protein